MTIHFLTQHYPPDDTSTAVYLAAIAQELARDDDVRVISGTRGSSSADGNPRVTEIPSIGAAKGSLVLRALAMLWFCAATFALLLWRARRTTPVFVVTTPFLLPYFGVLAARLRGAPAALIVYDLYPDVLILTGLTQPTSLVARAIRWINRWMYAELAAIIIIGRDMKKHISSYPGASDDKIHYIPHWSTLPAGERAIDAQNPFRTGMADKFVVGLSGNLGFTHDPETVFAAARLLSNNRTIHFLLSGWGVGWTRLRDAQQTEKLPNVTLIERVSATDLDSFLAAADAWIIPYRAGMSGISVPSRLYNLLAIGRPVIALAEPDAEHAIMLGEHDAGWVVEPEHPQALAETILKASGDPIGTAQKRRNAVQILQNEFSRDNAGERYRAVAAALKNLKGGAPS